MSDRSAWNFIALIFFKQFLCFLLLNIPDIIPFPLFNHSTYLISKIAAWLILAGARMIH